MSRSVEWAQEWIALSAQEVADNRELLIDLDRQIGDGDHGENLDRGFSAVVKGTDLSESTTGADVLKYVARTLMSTVGGAAGPLYGTAFLRAAQQFPEDELSAQDVANILNAALGGIQVRGKADAGEKTMVDAWIPAVAGAQAAADAGQSALQAIEAAAQGAQKGAEATEPMRATKGRASYLGERSIGHLDPGAVSTALILAAAANAAKKVWGQS